MSAADEYSYRNLGYGATETSAPKFKKPEQPMPSREELLARNSFGSPDDNKYLNRSKKK